MCDCKCKCNCFDPKKPVQTRDGKKARILATDLAGGGDSSSHDLWPIVAAIEERPGYESVMRYHTNGNFSNVGTHSLDLLNIPEKKEEFRTFIRDASAGAALSYNRTTEAAAINAAKKSTSNMIPLKFTYLDDELVSVDIIPLKK